MSVITSADELRDVVKESINQAVINLSEIVITRVWGWNDYNKPYQEKLKRILSQLIEMRDELD